MPIALRGSIVLTIQATLTSDAVSFVPDSTRSLGAQGGHAFAMPLSCLYYTELHRATLTEHPFHLFLDHPDSLLLEFNYDLPLKVGTIRPTAISLPIIGPSHCQIHSPQGLSYFLFNVHTLWLFVTVLPVEHRAFLRQATPTHTRNIDDFELLESH